MARTSFRALAILLLASLPSAAQVPPRDIGAQRAAPLPVDAGSAVVRGRVVDDTGVPVANAEVAAHATLPNATDRVVTTGADGRFEFCNLPQSSVWLRATKAGYGGRTGQSAERTVGPGAKALHEHVELVLFRSGVITGRVIGPDGEPVVGARVGAMVVRQTPRGRQLQTSRGSGSTDDRGMFRLFGLSPGTYYLHVVPAFRPGRMTGDAPSSGLAATFYPGTADPTRAVPIDVAPGAEIAADMTMPESALHRVSGRLVGLDGEPAANAAISIRARDGLLASMPVVSQQGMVRADGTFAMSGVPPGQYVATAHLFSPAAAATPGEWRPSLGGSTDVDVAADVDDVVIRLTLGATVRGRVVFGTDPPDDLAGFQITVRPLDMNGTSWRPPVPVDPDGTFEVPGLRGPVMFVVTGRMPAGVRGGLVTGGPGAAGASGPRTLAQGGLAGGAVGGIVDGRGQQVAGVAKAPVAVRSGGVNWRTRAVRVHGRDMPDLTVDAGQDGVVAEVEIEVAQDYAGVRGVVRGARGEPRDEATVVALAADGALLRHVDNALRARSTSRDEGRYFLGGLPPGTWDIVAVDNIADADMVSPQSDAQIERLRALATRVTLGPREQLVLDLVVVKP